MFVLVEMVDTVRIPPWQFERKLNDSIAEELNKKLANKVLGPRGRRQAFSTAYPPAAGLAMPSLGVGARSLTSQNSVSSPVRGMNSSFTSLGCWRSLQPHQAHHTSPQSLTACS